MTKDTFRFEIFQGEGEVGHVNATSFADARRQMSEGYETYYGKYTLRCGNETKNVNIK